MKGDKCEYIGYILTHTYLPFEYSRFVCLLDLITFQSSVRLSLLVHYNISKFGIVHSWKQPALSDGVNILAQRDNAGLMGFELTHDSQSIIRSETR